MNQIYLGHRAYGFAAAARTYFGKPWPTSPRRRRPSWPASRRRLRATTLITNLQRAEIRQHYVLGRMRALNYLDEAQYQAALAQPLTIRGMADAGGNAFRGPWRIPGRTGAPADVRHLRR